MAMKNKPQSRAFQTHANYPSVSHSSSKTQGPCYLSKLQLQMTQDTQAAAATLCSTIRKTSTAECSDSCEPADSICISMV